MTMRITVFAVGWPIKIEHFDNAIPYRLALKYFLDWDTLTCVAFDAVQGRITSRNSSIWLMPPPLPNPLRSK